MAILITVCILLTLGYITLIIVYWKGWQLQHDYEPPVHYNPQTLVSIIIAARNEAANIGSCVDAILAQNYPSHLFEVIVVNDHSADNTAAIVRSYQDDRVHCIDLAAHIGAGTKVVAYKKLAITTGIQYSKGELIITTDADCIAPANWLMNTAALYEQQQPVMIAGPVAFTCNNSVVQVFQSIDFMTMQGITAAAHRLDMGGMSNGANLAFSRTAFDAVNGYEGVDHLASGDDYLLMMKLQKSYPDRIAYLKSKDAIVLTAPQPDWGGFLQQRVRWASKSGKYDDKKLTGILVLVYLFNLAFPVLLVAGIYKPVLLLVVAGMLLLKTVAELFFLSPVAKFYGEKRQLWLFPLLQPLHILYIISAGFMGMIGVYKWKGRRTR